MRFLQDTKAKKMLEIIWHNNILESFWTDMLDSTFYQCHQFIKLDINIHPTRNVFFHVYFCQEFLWLLVE